MQPGKVVRITKGYYNTASLYKLSGRGAVRLARLHGVQEVPGSIPGAPTGDRLHCKFWWVSGLRLRNFPIIPEPQIHNIVGLSMVPPLNKKLPVSTESHRKGIILKPSAGHIGGW